MTELRGLDFCLSLDGYAAGPGQSMEEPLCAGGESRHEWISAPSRAVPHVRLRQA